MAQPHAVQLSGKKQSSYLPRATVRQPLWTLACRTCSEEAAKHSTTKAISQRDIRGACMMRHTWLGLLLRGAACTVQAAAKAAAAAEAASAAKAAHEEACSTYTNDGAVAFDSQAHTSAQPRNLRRKSATAVRPLKLASQDSV